MLTAPVRKRSASAPSAMRTAITPALAAESSSPAVLSEIPAFSLLTTKNAAAATTEQEASIAAAANTNRGPILTCPKRPEAGSFAARVAGGAVARSRGSISIPIPARTAPPRNGHRHPSVPPTTGTVSPASRGPSGMADMCTPKARP